MRSYYLIFAVFYSLEGIFAWLAPGHIHLSVVETVALNAGYPVAIGTCLGVSVLLYSCAVRDVLHKPSGILLLATSVATLALAIFFALTLTLHTPIIGGQANWIAPLVWWTFVTLHIRAFYLPSDLRRLFWQMRRETP